MQNSLFKSVRFILLSMTTKVMAGRWQRIHCKVCFFLTGQSSAVVHRILVKKPGSTFVENTNMYVYIHTYCCMLYILHLCVRIYLYDFICNIHLNMHLTKDIALKRGDMRLATIGFVAEQYVQFPGVYFVAAGWASTSWCFDVAYFTMGLDSLHPSISHNLWVGFLCSYSLFWEISFLFETMKADLPDNLIDTFEICMTRSSVRSAKYPKGPKSPWWGMLVGYAPFHQYNPVLSTTKTTVSPKSCVAPKLFKAIGYFQTTVCTLDLRSFVVKRVQRFSAEAFQHLPMRFRRSVDSLCFLLFARRLSFPAIN